VQPVETRYVWLGRDRIAYQVLGEGPPDLVVSFGSFGHIDIAWEDPGITLFFRTLTSFSRLILFDRRRMGSRQDANGSAAARTRCGGPVRPRDVRRRGSSQRNSRARLTKSSWNWNTPPCPASG
jgi:hypothetical protein